MSRDDFGAAPMKAEEAKIFVVDGDKHARIMRFKNDDDLKQTKNYYDRLGKARCYTLTHILKTFFTSNEWRDRK